MAQITVSWPLQRWLALAEPRLYAALAGAYITCQYALMCRVELPVGSLHNSFCSIYGMVLSTVDVGECNMKLYTALWLAAACLYAYVTFCTLYVTHLLYICTVNPVKSPYTVCNLPHHRDAECVANLKPGVKVI